MRPFPSPCPLLSPLFSLPSSPFYLLFFSPPLRKQRRFSISECQQNVFYSIFSQIRINFEPVQGPCTMNVLIEPLDDMACVVKCETPLGWRWKLFEFQYGKRYQNREFNNIGLFGCLFCVEWVRVDNTLLPEQRRFQAHTLSSLRSETSRSWHFSARSAGSKLTTKTRNRWRRMLRCTKKWCRIIVMTVLWAYFCIVSFVVTLFVMTVLEYVMVPDFYLPVPCTDHLIWKVWFLKSHVSRVICHLISNVILGSNFFSRLWAMRRSAMPFFRIEVRAWCVGPPLFLAILSTSHIWLIAWGSGVELNS